MRDIKEKDKFFEEKPKKFIQYFKKTFIERGGKHKKGPSEWEEIQKIDEYLEI